jgi:hypothetical protein
MTTTPAEAPADWVQLPLFPELEPWVQLPLFPELEPPKRDRSPPETVK